MEMSDKLEEALYSLIEEQNVYKTIFICPSRENATRLSLDGDEIVLEIGRSVNMQEKGRWFIGDPKMVPSMRAIISRS
jgi:hypothetical protein